MSKLNEFSNKYKQYKFKYVFLKEDRLTTTTIYRIMDDNSLDKFATGSAANKANSKQAAAEQALNKLKKMGLI